MSCRTPLSLHKYRCIAQLPTCLAVDVVLLVKVVVEEKQVVEQVD